MVFTSVIYHVSSFFCGIQNYFVTHEIIFIFLLLSFLGTFLPDSINKIGNLKSAVVFSGFMAAGNYFKYRQNILFYIKQKNIVLW